MSSRSTKAAVLAFVGLLLVTGCSAPAEPLERERASAEFDPFRTSRTDEFVSSSELLTTVKSAPTRLIVEAIDLDMRVDTKGLEPNGDMSLPVSPFRAGWYEYAAAPNSPGRSHGAGRARRRNRRGTRALLPSEVARCRNRGIDHRRIG